MAGPVYRVKADWDPEAQVWVAQSDDVPGLATEAPTIEALLDKLRIMVPELLEAHGGVPAGNGVPISLTAERIERLATSP